VREVLEAARRITGREIPVRVAPRRPGDPPELVADPSKIQRVLGWRARHDLDSVLRSAWAFQMRRG
jgi:UDP-glucose 4-epimerase